MSLDSGTPLGFEAARHVVELGRPEFFKSLDYDLPEAKSEQIRSDDLLPQFGFVGTRYEHLRVLFLGINPGNGDREKREPGDRKAMPAWSAFVANPIPETFIAAQRAYGEVCQGWSVWRRHCNVLLDAAGLGKEDIAFTNALPWRTKSESAYSKIIASRAASLYVRPVIAELRPNIIVAVGKKAAKVLEYAGLPSENVVVWNCARAVRDKVEPERNAAHAKFTELLEAVRAKL